MSHMMEFKERVDRTRAYNVLALNKSQFKEIFYESSSDNKGSNEWQTYFNQVRKYLTYVVAKDCMVTQKYKYADTNQNGRRYVKGLGVQSMQKTLRNYLCGELYYDVDMINAHPSILLHLCTINKIECPLLRDYVKNRDRILEENQLSKRDILVALYSDKCKLQMPSGFFASFVYEQSIIKPAIIDALNLKIDLEHQHPMASAISRYINIVENAILEKAMIEIDAGDPTNHVPMFDGFYVLKQAAEPFASKLRTLNTIMDRDYDGLIRFVQKSTDTNVQLADRGKPPGEYADVKPILEKKYFQTKQPFMFWQAYFNRDGVEKYSQLRINEMKLACEEYPIIDYKPNGDVFQTSIYNKWVRDPARRMYECCDFVPYGKKDTCPDYIFNTFQGFRIQELMPTTEYTRVDTRNFHNLIFNLCDCDVKITEYMIKYIAHMIQYPAQNSGVIIVFKSWAGVGKDTLMLTLKAMLGAAHVGTTGNIHDIFGNFNGLMEDKIAVFLNEMEGKYGVEFQNRLKDKATDRTNVINKKHDRPYEQSNCARIFVNSNNRTPVTVDASDRRYMVVQCGYGLVVNTSDPEERKKNQEFWKKYYEDLDNKYWVRSLYDWLMERDLTGFNCQNYPITQARELMRHKNICPLHYFLQDIIKNGYDGFTKRTVRGSSFQGEVHLIKFKDFCTMFDAFVTTNLKIEYEIKQLTVKQMLHELPTGCFRSDVRFNMGADRPQARFSTFDFDKIDKFLTTFVFKNCQSEQDDEVFELTEAVEAASLAPGVTHF